MNNKTINQTPVIKILSRFNHHVFGLLGNIFDVVQISQNQSNYANVKDTIKTWSSWDFGTEEKTPLDREIINEDLPIEDHQI